MAPALVGRGEEQVGVPRVEVNFIEARVVRHVQHAAPGFAAVGGLVNPAFAAGTPERAVGRNPHDVGIFRVHGDHADML